VDVGAVETARTVAGEMLRQLQAELIRLAGITDVVRQAGAAAPAGVTARFAGVTAGGYENDVETDVVVMVDVDV
jgi:hypothetical protein